MTIFDRHPNQQGLSYVEHLEFAMGIAWRLLRSVVAFTVHALLPWITIEQQLDLEATADFVLERNEFVEAAAETGRASNDGPPLAA